MKRKKPKSVLKTEKAKTWKLISEYVRRKDADDDGYTACYTCGASGHWKTMQCGHFFHGKLDYDLRNLKCQDARCNKFLHGNLAEYSARLIREEGRDFFDSLYRDAHKEYKYTVEELVDIQAELKGKLKELEMFKDAKIKAVF